jgi:hypothetical protein
VWPAIAVLMVNTLLPPTCIATHLVAFVTTGGLDQNARSILETVTRNVIRLPVAEIQLLADASCALQIPDVNYQPGDTISTLVKHIRLKSVTVIVYLIGLDLNVNIMVVSVPQYVVVMVVGDHLRHNVTIVSHTAL